MAKKTQPKDIEQPQAQQSFSDFGLEPVVLPVEELIPYTRNSREHSEEQINQIIASIKEFGFRNPVLLNEKNDIKAGHGRVRAAMKMGMTRVPCLRGKLTETQWRAYIIVDNRLAEKATWNNELLAVEFQELKLEGFNIELTGFTEAEIVGPEFVPSLPPDEGDSTTKGDVFVLRITFKNADEQQVLFNELRDRGYMVKV